MSFAETGDRPAFQPRFRSLVGDATEFTCPCDAVGHVDMDEMSERARSTYFFARAMVGRLYAPPEITAAARTAACVVRDGGWLGARMAG